uniref:Ima1 N-terminal domain-containing protein n=1 Tax=Cuerna arida TaxID=1464854 RepID=A0A1B6GQU4_9HEMI
MQMDSNIILPALATFSVLLLIIVKLYCKIRTKFPVKVNCWFCNIYTSVPYYSSNSWYCPSCDQYNGFSIDGSYNRRLPEQFNEKLNFGSWCTRTKKNPAPQNGLCQFCNINLELKVQQLSQFIPINNDNFDEEVQQYSDKLERVYKLCPKCEKVLEKTLISKEEKFITHQHHTFQPVSESTILQPKEKGRHTIYLNLTAALSMGLLLSVLPQCWVSRLLDVYQPPEWLCVPREVQSAVLLGLGVVVQLCDCAHMRDATSLVNLLLWLVLLYLTQVSGNIEGLVSIVHMLSAIVFFITSVTERKSENPKNVAAVKPVQLQKLDGKYDLAKRNMKSSDFEPTSKPKSPKSTVPDSCSYHASPSSHEPTPEDFGFSRLSMGSRRTSNGQTKHFLARNYSSHSPPELFRPKSFNLTPPKLQPEKHSEYQGPLTRSSSQSSGFVSMTQEYRSTSVVDDNLDSISQCGGAELTPYQMPLINNSGFPSPYGMPFSQFSPYAIVHFTPQPFSKFYPYSNMSPYVSSLNLSTISNQSSVSGSWLQSLKSVLSSLLFLFLITSNVAVLWKVFGEEYFKLKT